MQTSSSPSNFLRAANVRFPPKTDISPNVRIRPKPDISLMQREEAIQKALTANCRATERRDQ